MIGLRDIILLDLRDLNAPGLASKLVMFSYIMFQACLPLPAKAGRPETKPTENLQIELFNLPNNQIFQY